MALNVLAVLQDPDTRERVVGLLNESGHETVLRSVPESGFRVLSDSPVDVMILEYRGEARALELIQRLKEERPLCQIVIITDQESMNLREIPPQLGVRNVLYRPINTDILRRLVQHAGRGAQSNPADKPGSTPGEPVQHFARLTGSSPAFRSAVKVAEQASKSAQTPVLIIGESGTGKSLVARTIHDQSTRRSGPFIHVSCSSIAGELMESELFGHESGTFADSTGRKLGLIELASGGTLYLDDVSQIDLPLQAKLLRFMDSHRIRRVMSESDIEIDVRIIASTRRDLSRDVAMRSFRTDLYNRLSGVQVILPPLRERGADVIELTRSLVDRLSRRLNRSPMSLTAETERLLLEYNWPGNVGELCEAVERAVMSKSGGELRPEDFPVEAAHRPLNLVDFSDQRINVRLPESGVGLEEIEKHVIETTLDRCRGNVMEAARFLRMGRGALRYRIAKHGLEEERDDARQLRRAS